MRILSAQIIMAYKKQIRLEFFFFDWHTLQIFLIKYKSPTNQQHACLLWPHTLIGSVLHLPECNRPQIRQIPHKMSNFFFILKSSDAITFIYKFLFQPQNKHIYNNLQPTRFLITRHLLKLCLGVWKAYIKGITKTRRIKQSASFESVSCLFLHLSSVKLSVHFYGSNLSIMHMLNFIVSDSLQNVTRVYIER